MIESYLMETCFIVTQIRDTKNRITPKRIPVKCRRDSISKMVTTDSGEEVLSTDMVTMASRTIDPDAKIELGGRQFKVLTIKRPKDFNFNIIEVYL